MSRPVLVSAKKEKNAAPYVEALRAVNVPAARIRVVTRDDDPGGVRELASEAAGMVLCGGADVDPRLYHEEMLEGAVVKVDAARDRVEWALLDGARDAAVPVWAICRGLQVVNVYLGGTLWQDLPTQNSFSSLDHYPDPEGPKDTLVHEVTLLDGATELGASLAGHPLGVNSRHHQAIKDLAPGLVAVAAAPDGLIEACELPASGGWWLRAVQWHPENLVALPGQRALWSAFATAAGAAP